MDFEWKQRVIFTFVLAGPLLLALANPHPSNQQNGIRWPKNPEKVRVLQEFQAAQKRYAAEIVKNATAEAIPICTTTSDEFIEESFDGRKVWTNCSSLFEIRDSGHCNSWATAVASVLTDRFCIASKGSIQYRVSDQDLINCASEINSEEIEGSPCPYQNLPSVWEYIQENGVVSGGYLNSERGCQPTTVAPCEGNSSSTCLSPPPQSLTCNKETCDNPTFGLTYQEDRKDIVDVCRLPRDYDNSVAHIQHEIRRNGPVLAVMNLYHDLRQFNQSVGFGIYESEHEESERHETHPVKILGWGSENNGAVRYWIVANTGWGYNFGDGGIFRVRMSQERPKLGAFITTNPIYCPTPNVYAALQNKKSVSFLQNILNLFQFP